MHRFGTQKLKLSNFGRMLLHEFVCTFYSYWFWPKVATTETIDIISDICCWWNYKIFKLNLTYWMLLHWIGAIKREGNITVEKIRLNVFKISIVVLCAFLTFHTSAPNWMKLSGPISGALIYIRNTSQLGTSKFPLRHYNYLYPLRYCDLSWHSIHSCVTHWVVFLTLCCWPSADEKQTWKHAAIPILFLDTYGTVIYWSLPSVLDYKACQEPLFPLYDFWLLD